MIAFAELLDRLTLTPGRLAKIALLKTFFARETDPDRGWALAALTSSLSFPSAKAGLIRSVAEARVDPVLFRLSYDFVGDLAETTSLIWPEAADCQHQRRPASTDSGGGAGHHAREAELPARIVAAWLDGSDASVRLRPPQTHHRRAARRRLRPASTKIALAELAAAFGHQHRPRRHRGNLARASHPPISALFAWLEGHGPRPDPADRPASVPPAHARPPDRTTLTSRRSTSTPTHVAEWKLGRHPRATRLAPPAANRIFSRGADDISATFPEILAAMNFQADAVLDGELLVIRHGTVAPFADLQQRLNRRAPTSKVHAQQLPRRRPPLRPAVRRLRKTSARSTVRHPPRQRLDAWVRPAPVSAENATFSPLIPFWNAGRPRNHPRQRPRRRHRRPDAETKRQPLRARSAPKGLWWKWKRDPLTVDAVLMYAQRGHGKRSSFYS